jgi:hypothetical protein
VIAGEDAARLLAEGLAKLAGRLQEQGANPAPRPGWFPARGRRGRVARPHR